MCVWVEDADKLEFSSDELKVVFMNRAIKSYLNEVASLGLAGIKGQGKTFLIKVKRNQIRSNPSIICLPNNRMVDIIDSSVSIDKSLYNYLVDYNIWVDMWKFSICAAILTCPQLKENFDIDKLKVKRNTKEFLKIKNAHSEAGFVAKQLLNSDIKTFMALLDDTGKLFDYVKSIHQSVCLFFDKIDQGFSKYAKNFNADTRLPGRSRNASIWQYAQYSLAEASYDIFSNTAHHVKVYYTIRQEALIDSESLNKDKARNINGFITVLQYTKGNLLDMYNMYIASEKDKNLVVANLKTSNPSAAFLGVEQVEHGYIPDKEEDVFDYIYRHSFRRPYDIMRICRALYIRTEATRTLEIKDIRTVVNRTSNELLNFYLHELGTFLPCNIDEIDRVVKMMPGNILDIALMKTICDTFNSESQTKELWYCNQECSICGNLQPFSVLYNLGLIGSLRKHEADDFPYQEFKNIGDSILELNTHALPVSKIYFLHPALSNRARDERAKMGFPFEMNRFLLVGDGCTVEKVNSSKMSRFIYKCKNLVAKEHIFVSSTIFDLQQERQAIRRQLKTRELHPIMSEYSGFDLSHSQLAHSHDCCLDAVLKCKSFIFVIGEQYGGIYQGQKYQKEKAEISQLSKGKITEPSISLMEYYIARKNKLKCYAFIDRKIDEPQFKENLPVDVINEINFLTHFSPDGNEVQGNWISRYSSIRDLMDRIGRLKFI